MKINRVNIVFSLRNILLRNSFFILLFFFSLSLISCESENFEQPVYPPKPSKEACLFGKNADSRFYFSSLAYRIPCVTISAKDQILLATSDIRYDSGDDLGVIEVAFCRSLDGGRTWKDYKKIFHRNPKSNSYNRVHDASLCVDRNPKSKYYGRIWAFAKMISTDLPENQWSTTGIMIFLSCYSDDNGLTWSNQKEMTNLFPKDAFHTSTGISPGITLSNGILVLPTYFSQMVNGVKQQRASFIYSNDGKTWRAGPVAPLESGENSIIQQADGSLLMNARSAFFDTARRRVFSLNFKDKTFDNSSWVNRPEYEVFRTVNCQESLVYNKGVYLISKPTGYEDGSGRNRITIFRSTDLINWDKLALITSRPSSGYSSIILTDNYLGVIYEAPGAEINFSNMNDFLQNVYIEDQTIDKEESASIEK